MGRTMKYCFEHKHEVKKGKRACEYRLIWERDVTGLAECDMAEAVIVRSDVPLYRICGNCNGEGVVHDYEGTMLGTCMECVDAGGFVRVTEGEQDD